MSRAKFFIATFLASVLVLSQVSAAFARPTFKDLSLLSGSVVAVSLETDPNTGVHTVVVTLRDAQGVERSIRISEKTAYHDLHLLDYNDDGNPFIVSPLPGWIDINASTVTPDEEDFHHPVANALATYFSDIEGVDYDAIMDAHRSGFGFGVIAQALWMIKKLDGTAEDFMLLLQAKRDGDYSDFPLSDGTIPTKWGELRKAISQNLGIVMSHKDKTNKDHADKNSQGNHGNNPDKNKDKSNNGNAGGNGNTNGHSNKP